LLQISLQKGYGQVRLFRVYWCQLQVGFIGKAFGFHRIFIRVRTFATNQASKGSVNLGVAWVNLVGQGLGTKDIRFFGSLDFRYEIIRVRICYKSSLKGYGQGSDYSGFVFLRFRIRVFLGFQVSVSVSFALDCYNDVKIHSPTPLCKYSIHSFTILISNSLNG
jgi:hypothetical protein